MRRGLYIALSLMLTFSSGVEALEEPAVSPAPGSTESAPIVPVERPKLLERPKPVEKPKPVERPRSEPENSSSTLNPALSAPSKPTETVAPGAVSAPAPSSSVGSARSSTSFGCLVLAFAMLILGIGVGFLGRHLMSRHKLGGMTVRIGTWRGIP